jgi:uncharacterized protein (TIGR00255 family)
MILSMTGYGKAEYGGNGIKVSVEIQSVNSRFFELKAKLPRFLNEYENILREVIQGSISRGRVSLTITVDSPEQRIESYAIDFNLAGKYVELAEDLSKRYNIDNRVDARALLSMPDIFLRADNESGSKNVWEIVRRTLVSALDAHRAMREKEGAAIGADVSGRLKSIMSDIGEIEHHAPGAVEENTSRLRKKIETLLDAEKIDEIRFAMEVALYADRVDITEECVRFKSHTRLFASEIESEKTSGRKLAFLLQEMNREANTTASKAQDAVISQIVIHIKEELEKMREQVENME